MNTQETVVVTGANSGIGRSTALLLASKGYKVALSENESLLKGLNIYKESVTHEGVAQAFNLPYVDPLSIF